MLSSSTSKSKNKTIKKLENTFSLCDSKQLVKFDTFKEIGRYLMTIFTSLSKLKKEELIDCLTQTLLFFSSDFNNNGDRNSFFNLALTSSDILSAFLYIINEGYFKDTSIASINNHECFDIMIYIIKGLIENYDHLNKFVDTIYSLDNGKEKMINFICILGKSINNAISYSSNSYSLDILIRLYIFYCESSKHKNANIIKMIKKLFPECLIDDIEKNQIDVVLNNIRKYLHIINKTNNNIESIQIKLLKLSEPTPFHEKITTEYLIMKNTWMEIDIINAEFISSIEKKKNAKKIRKNHTSIIESSGNNDEYIVIFTMESIPESIVALTNFDSNRIYSMNNSKYKYEIEFQVSKEQYNLLYETICNRLQFIENEHHMNNINVRKNKFQLDDKEKEKKIKKIETTNDNNIVLKKEKRKSFSDLPFNNNITPRMRFSSPLKDLKSINEKSEITVYSHEEINNIITNNLPKKSSLSSSTSSMQEDMNKEMNDFLVQNHINNENIDNKFDYNIVDNINTIDNDDNIENIDFTYMNREELLQLEHKIIKKIQNKTESSKKSKKMNVACENTIKIIDNFYNEFFDNFKDNVKNNNNNKSITLNLEINIVNTRMEAVELGMNETIRNSENYLIEYETTATKLKNELINFTKYIHNELNVYKNEYIEIENIIIDHKVKQLKSILLSDLNKII